MPLSVLRLRWYSVGIMTADVRSLGGGLPSVFDFDSQSGILFLLRAIRASEISSGDKNKLKDLVFLYNTGGKDVAVKQRLTDQLATLGVSPESVLLEVPKNPPSDSPQKNSTGVAGFSLGRLVPLFTAPVIMYTQPEVKKIIPKIVTSPVLASVPQVEVVAPVEPASQSPVTAPAQKFSPVVPVAARPLPSAPVVSARPLMENMPIANDIKLRQKIQVNEPSPSSVPQTPTLPTEPVPAVAVARIERIRVIKSDVNARVGNPVNLVDADNALGREYMSALLEAMKLLSSASEIDSAKAMDRLESVYQKVLELLATREKVAAADVPRESLLAAEIIPPAAVVADPVINQAPAAEPAAVVNVPVPVPMAPKVESENLVLTADTDYLSRSKVSNRATENPAANNWNMSETTVMPNNGMTSVAQSVMPKEAVTVERMSTSPAEQLRPIASSVTPVYTPETAQSVNNITPLRAITELPTADEVSAVEAMNSNPLYTKDIDAGLEQLLGEWAIFKKSGLFGTGPKGREHPLFIKIAQLPVPLILSGRFEGSTQEIKQSITDYMNGWRYEQGIIYEANETLELYLRRVIRHIIDLQKIKRRS